MDHGVERLLKVDAFAQAVGTDQDAALGLACLLQQPGFFGRKSLFDGRRTALEAKTWCHIMWLYVDI
jgi:hypothetical protein